MKNSLVYLAMFSVIGLATALIVVLSSPLEPRAFKK